MLITLAERLLKAGEMKSHHFPDDMKQEWCFCNYWQG